MEKIAIGDIFEINTTKGKGLVHYVYKNKMMGELVRVLPGLYSELPYDLSTLVSQKEMYMVYFPLSIAFKKGIVNKVGSFSRSRFEKPKYMRTDHFVKGNFLGWYIVDTDTWQRSFIKELTKEQKQLSPWGIWNYQLLIEKLTSGWTLDKWI